MSVRGPAVGGGDPKLPKTPSVASPMLVLPPLQNLKPTPTPTAVYGARRSFRMTLSLDVLQTNTLPLGVQSLLKLAAPVPRLEDLVLMLELSGVENNGDRIDLATFCASKIQTYIKSQAPGLQSETVHQAVKQFDTVSSCTPSASQTFFFWHTATPTQRQNLITLVVNLGGLAGLADAAFGPLTEVVGIPHDGLVELYTRVLNPYVPGAAGAELVVGGQRISKTAPYFFNLTDDRVAATSVAKRQRGK